MNKSEIDSGYITHEPAVDLVFVNLVDGKIDLNLHLCNEVDTSEEMSNAITAWANDTAQVAIAPHFTVASPVDYLVDSHQMPARNNDIDMDSKPIFDALRAEMLAQIARIDALIFA